MSEFRSITIIVLALCAVVVCVLGPRYYVRLGNSGGSTGGTALHQAAENGHNGTTADLIKDGADPNALDDQGRTPLHLAAAGGHQATAEAIMRAGGDLTLEDAEGKTPLHLAAANGHQHLVKFMSAASK